MSYPEPKEVTVLLKDLKPSNEHFDLIGETVRLDIVDTGPDDPGTASVYANLAGLTFFDDRIVITFSGGPAPLDFTKDDLNAEGVTVSLTTLDWSF